MEVLHRAALRHSVAVRVARAAIPLAVVCAIGTVAAPWMKRLSAPATPPPDLADSLPRESRTTMHAARLSGFRADGAPFEVVAERADQDARRPGTVGLAVIRGHLDAPGLGPLKVSAARGVLEAGQETLRLAGDVQARLDGGDTLTMRSAVVGLKAGTLSSAEPVFLDSARGTVTADGMEASAGPVISFVGNVRAVILPQQPRTD